MMGVFASPDVATVQFTKDSLGRDGSIAAVAEVFDYDASSGYSVLGIGPYFSCLYLYRTNGHFEAKMRWVGAADSTCHQTYNAPDNVPGTPLAVIETHADGYGDYADYPPVARWDWDDDNAIQYIGIKCGYGWCEIGPGKTPTPGSPPAFKPSRPNWPPTSSAASAASGGVTLAGMTPSKENRVRGIKGWYDEQFLARESSSDAAPSRVRGAIFPDTDLAKLTNAALATWQVSSYIAIEQPAVFDDATNVTLRYYKRKFNLDPFPVGTPLANMNKVLMCLGTADQCKVPSPPTRTMCNPPHGAPPLWAAITSPVTNDTLFRCATAFPNTSTAIMATARWRWLAKDETSWRWCPTGCCQVDAGGIY
jgi:hypothetical protein